MKKRNLKKEIFAIPNILCYFRILLIPVFCVLYLGGDHYLAAIVLAVAAITDKFDGTIARKFNMITDLGKVIDPIADKLMQFAVALCLSTTHSLMIVLAVALFIKELYMGIKGLLNIKSGERIYNALWFGKMCTVVLFISMIILVMLPADEVVIANTLIAINLSFMLFSLVMYMIAFRRMRMKTIRDRLKEQANMNDVNEESSLKENQIKPKHITLKDRLKDCDGSYEGKEWDTGDDIYSERIHKK